MKNYAGKGEPERKREEKRAPGRSGYANGHRTHGRDPVLRERLREVGFSLPVLFIPSCPHLEWVFQSSPWRLISAILGIICLSLMATLGILLTMCSDCCSCPEKWIGYKSNCYFISNKKETWAESRNFCISQNSTLFHPKSKDQLGFLKYSPHFYWLGLSYNETGDIWLWEDGSALSQQLPLFTSTLDREKCILYSPMEEILNELCEKKNYYICQH
ncbi:natural killer cells antigen CD94 [Echinops telfairi]|uniref:Natural killer cells antigen CD94 n=1 Tax=Echinops telfairi TaxID=9371 RepID=A0ABM0ZU12_ECHTE|nr:natural killer cells antigen CD94 [Echinops telfairi]